MESKDENGVLEAAREKERYEIAFCVSEPKKCLVTVGQFYNPLNVSGHEFKQGSQLEKARTDKEQV